MSEKKSGLKPFDSATARTAGAAGGVASGVTRRRKRDLKQAANLLLSLEAPKNLSPLFDKLGVAEEDRDNMMALLSRAMMDGANGNIRAIELLFSAAGYDRRGDNLKRDELKLKRQQVDQHGFVGLGGYDDDGS
jgi:hypothetical protein